MTDLIVIAIALLVGFFLGILVGGIYWMSSFEDYHRTVNLELTAIKTRLAFVRKSVEAKERVKAKKDEEHKWEKDHQEELIE